MQFILSSIFRPAERVQSFSLRPLQSGLCLLTLALFAPSAVAATSYPLEVLPPEHQQMTDPRTGAELLFLTSSPERDANLYFHEYSWLEDESVILFVSSRTNGGLMGYVTATGELIRLHTPQGGLSLATAAAKGNAVLAARGREAVEIKLAIEPSDSPATRPSRVTATERVLCMVPDGSPACSLNPSCDGKYVAFGVGCYGDKSQGPAICKVNIKTGKFSVVCRLPEPPGYGGHVQWSRTNPNLISFAGRGQPLGDITGRTLPDTAPEDYAARAQRLWVVDIRDGVPRNVYQAAEDELVTHESWWINDTILFCGGARFSAPDTTNKAVLSHVKELNIYTGDVCIAGGGAWWPEGSPSDVARLNWWHVAGSANGRWIAADNWHGDVMIFEGKTTRPHLLTAGHRTYGRGDHPHMGWDRKGEKVVFASHLIGNLNVCVATIPKSWQDAASANRDGLRTEQK